MSSTKELARELFVKGFDVNKIAQILNKSPKTISNYKTKDGDWENARALTFINRDEKDKLYTNFIDEMNMALKEIREDENLSAKEKATAISQIGDSFSKMRKVANYEDPESYKLAITRRVIQLIVTYFKYSEQKSCIEKIVELIEDKRFTSDLGNLDIA